MNTKAVSGIVLTGVIFLALSLSLAVPTTQAKSEHSSSDRGVRYPAVGTEVKTLPQGSRAIQVNKKNYRYNSGSFYARNRKGAYAVVRAPIGARVRTLPGSYVRFNIGSRHYFYANLAYYLWSTDRTEYVVVEKPTGAEVAMESSSESLPAEDVSLW